MQKEEFIINCPACGEEMEKVRIDSAGFFVDVCTKGCGGIWLDNRELPKVDEKHEDIHEITEVLKDKKFVTVDKTAKRNCPICLIPMVKNSTSIKQTIEIDECYVCGGKFLDHNELEAIRGEYATDEDRTIDILKASVNQETLENIFKKLLEKDTNSEFQE